MSDKNKVLTIRLININNFVYEFAKILKNPRSSAFFLQIIGIMRFSKNENRKVYMDLRSIRGKSE